MKNNENIVIIQTKEKEAKRKILAVIEEGTGLSILLHEEPFCMKTSLNNDIMINIIKMLIMEGLLNVVSIRSLGEQKAREDIVAETSEKQQEKVSIQEQVKEGVQDVAQQNTEDDIQENSPKDLKRSAESSNTKDVKDKKKVTEKILFFMQQEKRILTNAEINKGIGEVTEAYLSNQLNLLFKEGKIERVRKGQWKVKDIEGDITVSIPEEQAKEEKKEKQQEQETKEKTVKLEISEEIQEWVLNFFQTTGWQMTKEEVVHKLNIEPGVVTPILDILVQNKKLQKEGENYKLYKSPFGLFENQEYRILLDYIMGQSHFSEGYIKSKFPQEYYKLGKLLKQMEPKYIKERQDCKGSYNVYLKGRVLYYVLTHHNNMPLADIRHAFSTISNQEISNTINIAIRAKELKRDATGSFMVLKM